MVSRWKPDELAALRAAYAECGPEDNAEQFWRAVARKMRTTKPWRRVMSRGRRDKLRSKVRAGSRSASRWAATPGEGADV